MHEWIIIDYKKGVLDNFEVIIIRGRVITLVKRKSVFKRLVAAVAVVTTLFTFSPATSITAKAENDTRAVSTENAEGFTDDGESSSTDLTYEEEQGAILHAWDWSFKTIEENLQAIADAGYKSIQVSPIQGNKDLDGDYMLTSQWWILYQPINFKIGNKQLGTRDEFKSMCSKAKEYGINIYVDVIANHTGNDNGDATKYPSCVQKEILDLGDDGWHIPLKSTTDWDDRYDVTHGCVGLPDLNTENKTIQKLAKNYFQDCLDCGADGFRVDTAKHIGLPTEEGKIKSDFWPAAFSGLKTQEGNKPYVYGEVLQGGADNFAEYSKYINLTSSNYGDSIRQAVGFNSSPDVSKVENYKADGVDSGRLITWVESHDTYANDSEESTAMTDEEIKDGWAIIAARAKANPLFYNRPAGRGKLDGNIGDMGDDLWRDPDVVAVNKFREAMIGKDEKLTELSKEAIIIERGTGKDAGLVIVNMGDSKDISGQEVNLSDGTYSNCGAADSSFTVADGKINGVIPEGITVLYGEGSKEENVLIPEVSITPDNKSFSENSLELTLKCKNSSNATYSINNGEKKNYTDGQKITVGEDSNVGDIINVTLEGSNPQGNRNDKEVYKYVKKDKNSCAAIYFKRGENFKKPYVYAYNDLGENNGAWPGQEMTYIGNGIYKYELKDFTDCSVMINDWFYGSNKTDDLKIGADDKKIYDESDKSWKAVTEPITEDPDASDDSLKGGTSKVYFQKPEEWADYSDIDIYFYGKGGPNWPGVPMKKVEGKDNLYTYNLPEGLEDSSVMFNANGGKVQIPGHNQSGLKAPADSTMIYDGTWHEYINGASKAYFRKPKDWAEPNIYVWKDGKDEAVEKWPGIKMTKVNGTETLYSYTLPEGYAAADDKIKVIFNDGTNQTGDLELPYEKLMIYDENGGSKEFTLDDLEEPEEPDDSEDNSVTKVYFKNDDNWDKVKVYAFNNDPFKEVKGWPGVSAKDEGNNLYSYSLPKGYENAVVIFNNGNGGDGNQTENLQTTAGHSMIYDKESKSLKDLAKVYFKNSSQKWEKVCVHYWNDGGASTEWPGKKMTYYGDDLYGYEMPEDFVDANVIFNNNNNGSQSETFKSEDGKTMILDEDGKWREFTSEDVPDVSDSGDDKDDGNKDDDNESDELTKAYFYNKDNWTDIKAYVYKEDKDGNMVKEIKGWPGSDMTSEGDNLYSFILPKGFKNSVLIFNGYGDEKENALATGDEKDADVKQDAESSGVKEIEKTEETPAGTENNQSSDKTQDSQAEDKSQNAQNEDKSQDSQGEDKSQNVQNGDKSQDSQVEDKSQNVQSGDKSQASQAEDKSQNVQNEDKAQDVQADNKSQDVQSKDKLQDADTESKSDDAEAVSQSSNKDSESDTESKLSGQSKASGEVEQISNSAALAEEKKREQTEAVRIKDGQKMILDKDGKWREFNDSDKPASGDDKDDNKGEDNTGNNGGDDNSEARDKAIISSVSISGIAKVGKALTAEVVFEKGVSGDVKYKWQRSDSLKGVFSDIENADSKTYTLTGNDYRKYIRVTVSNDDTETPVNSAATERVIYQSSSHHHSSSSSSSSDKSDADVNNSSADSTEQASKESGAANNTSSENKAGNDVENGWKENADHTWQYIEQGNAVSGWKNIDTNWYYMDEAGIMKKDWIKVNNVWYYLNDNGSMATGWLKADDGKWYYLSQSGAMITGWMQDTDGNWYFLNNDGSMATGWINNNGSWYYLNNSGAMEYNTVVDGYVVNQSGEWIA